MAWQSSSNQSEEFLEARRVVRAAIHTARARMEALRRAEPGEGTHPRVAAEKRLRSAFAENIAGSSISADRSRAAIAFVTVGAEFTGTASSGVALMRQEFDFRNNAKMDTRPAIVLTSHLMQRLYERVGVDDLDGFIKVSKRVMGWSEVARQAGVRGDFLVPSRSGIWCCTMARRGLIDASGQAHDVAAIKTFIDNAHLEPALATMRSRLTYYEQSVEPSFPLVDGPGSKELIAMAEMAAAGAERQARRQPGQKRNSTPEAMGF